jgi:predicted phosphodiesterase
MLMKNKVTWVVFFSLLAFQALHSQAPAPSPSHLSEQGLRNFSRGDDGRGGRGRGGGGAIDDVRQLFKTEVPPHDIDVILGRPTRDSVTLSILSYADREAFVEFGPESEPLSKKTSVFPLNAGVPAEIVLSGLKADTACSYRIHSRIRGGPWNPEPAHTFRTQRPPGEAFTFTLQADSHLDYNTEPALYLRCLSNALADRPDFHIDLGDTFMTDKHRFREFAAAQYVAQRYYFGQIAHSIPLFLVLGNHDGESGRWLDGTTNNMALWSNTQRKRYFPDPEPNGFYPGNTHKDPVGGLLQDYYAWQWGDALFIVLDPFWYTTRQRGGDDNWSRSLGREQYDWLKKTLEESGAKYRFVFIHHLVGGNGKDSRGGAEAAPFFEWGGRNPDGTQGFKDKRPGWPMPIHDLLVKNHVNVVFHGHDHLFVKQDLDGIVYQEVPQPGYPRYDNTRSAEEYGYRSGILLPSPGHLRVEVTPERAKVDYVRSVLPSRESGSLTNGAVSASYEIKPR